MSSRDLLKLRPEQTALVELGAAAVPPAQKDSFRAKVANYLTGIRYLSDGDIVRAVENAHRSLLWDAATDRDDWD